MNASVAEDDQQAAATVHAPALPQLPVPPRAPAPAEPPMESPSSFQPQHAPLGFQPQQLCQQPLPLHLLPEDWSDTDQRIFESFLLAQHGELASELTFKGEGGSPSSSSTLGDEHFDGKVSVQRGAAEAVTASVGVAAMSATDKATATGPAAKKKRASRKRVSPEEKKMKHREVQRRFMQRKKESMARVKQSIAGLEKQVALLKLHEEKDALESENQALQSQMEVQAAKGLPSLSDLEHIFEEEARVVEALFQPFSVERWEALVCQTLRCVDSTLSNASMQASGVNVMGWADHRNLEDTSLKFTLHKHFPNVCAEDLWNTSWDRITTDCYASFFNPSLIIRKHLLQRVCDDAIIIYRVICYPESGRISRAIEVISRVRREHDFVYFVRTLDMPDVKEQLGHPGAWTQSLTVLRFVPSDPLRPEVGCTVQYGGNYVKIPRGGVKYWLMEILFLVLRFESSLIAPMFSLGN